jgi:hypothetical protein
MSGSQARSARTAAADLAGKTRTPPEPQVVACPRCGAEQMFRRSLRPLIDSCGFESYSFACRECAAPLGGIVDPCDDTLLLSELATQVR